MQYGKILHKCRYVVCSVIRYIARYGNRKILLKKYQLDSNILLYCICPLHLGV